MSSSGCTCQAVAGAASVGSHLSSCMIGPAASSTSLLNEWLLIRTLQLADELPDPLPAPAPVQYAMVLPSLQLLSFIVCRAADSEAGAASFARYEYGGHDVLLTVRDCRMKRVWRLRQCYGPKRTTAAEQPSAAAAPSSSTVAHSSGVSASQPAEDRFYQAWMASRQTKQSANSDTSADAAAVATAASISSTSAASLVSSSVSSSGSAASSSVSSNLRTAIAAAKARSSPFASSIGASSRQSSWKAAPQPFSLFDAWGEAEAWLNTQQHNVEHEHYMRCIAEQRLACAQQPPQPPLTAMARPSVDEQVEDVGDGWSELHALLHHLGFFSSLLPPHAVVSASTLSPYAVSPPPFSLLPSSADVSTPSLLLLHPSVVLTDSIDELDAISDTQLHRVMILIRRAQQSAEWEMIANCCTEDGANEQRESHSSAGPAQHSGPSNDAFSSLLASLSELSSRSRQSEQVVWFVPSRLCPLLLSAPGDASVSLSASDERFAVWNSLLAACVVRVVWCEGEADYVSLHRQRQRDRRQQRRAREKRDKDGATGVLTDASRSPASLSGHRTPTDASTALSASQLLPHRAALVYLIVSFNPTDGTYRLRIDCDWRLRNNSHKPRRDDQLRHGRSQSHSNAIVSAASAGGTTHSSRWLPPPLVKSNSLTNTQPLPPPSISAALPPSSTSSAVFKSLFKRLGSRSARSSGQSSEQLTVSDGRRGGDSSAGSRTSSLSPARPSTASSSHFPSRASPRRGRLSKQDSDGGVPSQYSSQQQQQQQQQQEAERRRSERADALRRHPILSQPFPPSDCFVGLDGLAARLSEAALLSARRVHAWREWRLSAQRRRQAEAGSQSHPSRRQQHDGWGRGQDVDEHSSPRRASSSAAMLAMEKRSRLLRDMVREHGEVVTPASFFESVFGQHGQPAATAR